MYEYYLDFATLSLDGYDTLINEGLVVEISGDGSPYTFRLDSPSSSVSFSCPAGHCQVILFNNLNEQQIIILILQPLRISRRDARVRFTFDGSTQAILMNTADKLRMTSSDRLMVRPLKGN